VAIKRSTRTVSFSSGKGGVGKSTLVANVAAVLGQKGFRVLILDGDMGLANQDVIYGVKTFSNVSSVLSGERTLNEILVEVAPNVQLIPGGNGIYGMQNLSSLERKNLMDQVSAIGQPVDFLLIDTASGIDDNVLYLGAAAQTVMVVVTPDPASMTDAYALIKVMNQKCGESRFSIVANMVHDEREALSIFKRLSDVTQRFLNVGLDYKGFVPMDYELRKANKAQELVTAVTPRASSSQQINMLADKLNYDTLTHHPKGGMQFFWESLVGVA
jgi:flagellar biosynthesis protein FlhG